MKRIYTFLIVMACLGGGSVAGFAQDSATPDEAAQRPVRPPTAQEILDLPEPKFTLPGEFSKPVFTVQQEVEEEVPEDRAAKIVEEAGQVPRWIKNSRNRAARNKYPLVIPKTLPVPEVIYLDPPEVTVLEEQLDGLLFGISIDIPPVHDIYGYEIRRYMSGVFSDEVFLNEKELKKQLANVRRAKIILSYWEGDVLDQAQALEKRIESESFSDVSITRLNYNNEIARVFFTEAREWMEKNEALLGFMARHFKEISVTYPYVEFKRGEDAKHFNTLFSARGKFVKKMHEYLSFRTIAF